MTGEHARPVARVVVPVAGTDREYVVQEQAAEWAAALDVPLYALHVSSAPDEINGDVWHYVNEVCERWGVDCETRAIAGTDPAEEVLQEVDAMDLIVIGTRKMTGRFHLGSVTDAILKDAPCAVQVVRLE